MSHTFITPDRLSKAPMLRLICFPYAGGGAAVYYRWRPYIPRTIDLWPVCLPGRERRVAEPPATDLIDAAHQIAAELSPHLDRPWVAVGHSMGAWLAFEVVRELRRLKSHPPALLVVAGSRAPHLSTPSSAATEPPLHKLPDDELLSAVHQRYSGIPSSISENADLVRLLLPTLRADIQMVETYRYVEQAPLEVEILALGATDDLAVSASQLAAWRRHTRHKFSSRLLPGDHFFLFRGAGSLQGPPGNNDTIASRPPALTMITTKLEQIVGAVSEFGRHASESQ